MPDNLSAADRLKTMRAVRSRNTGLERKLYAMLAGMHLSGWQEHATTVQGNPDAVFEGEHVAIFMNGCFWHGCPVCRRKLPATNAEYWTRKIERNVQRDEKNREMLTASGWTVVTIWEHELRNTTEKAIIRERIRIALAKEG